MSVLDSISSIWRDPPPVMAFELSEAGVALIIPDYCTRISVLDFDDFPKDAKEQLALVRFRMKKAVPYDVESAAVSYWAQSAPNKDNAKKFEVVVVVAPI